jgi:E3 ubiquitin-protein ligase RNF216
MIQCPEAHLFCKSCMTSYASTLLGSHDTNINCMHQSGCTVAISRSELQRFLPKKLMNLWERLTQRKEVQAAGLDGWEECPFCEWGCVIENAEEKLFRCDGCGVVSCRGCKKIVRNFFSPLQWLFLNISLFCSILFPLGSFTEKL